MSLVEKLQKLQESETANQIDWEKRKKGWQEEIEKIMNETKQWFQSYLQNDLFKFVETEKLIDEEYLGTYKTKQWEYEFGSFHLVFEPIGRNILGAKGRIDIYLRGSKADRYMLVLLEINDGHSKWILSPFKDKSNRINFNKENLEKIIEELIDQYTK